MGYRYTRLAFVSVFLLLAPPAIRGDDVDDLKGAAGQVAEAFNSHNIDTFSATLPDGVTFFLPGSPFPLDGKAAVQQSYQGLFANTERLTLTLINPQYRVIGTTGIVWGHLAVASKPKDGPLTTNFLRFTWTFAKVDGKWLRVANHLSQLPSGN